MCRTGLSRCSEESSTNSRKKYCRGYHRAIKRFGTSSTLQSAPIAVTIPQKRSANFVRFKLGRRAPLTSRGTITLCSYRHSSIVLAIDPHVEAIAKAEDTFPVELTERVRFEIDSAIELNQPPASFDCRSSLALVVMTAA
jgi:hypothetical protein